MVERQSYWREGENLRGEIEQLVQAEKVWVSLRRFPPGPGQAEVYTGDLRLAVPDNRLEARGPLTIHAYRETGGQVLIWLWAGNVALRRAHVGAGHGEPDRGPYFPGPHIHFPTTVFREIGGNARTRVYPWEVPETVTLREAISLFALEINLADEPEGFSQSLEPDYGL